MNRLLRHSQLFLKRNTSTILTCVGGAGVVVTSVMAVKATPKALVLLDKAREEKGDDLTTLEKVKAAAPVYIPSVLVGASTITCIFGANILNKRQQAALMSAYALLDNSYKEYKNKVEKLYGEEADTQIKKEIAKDRFEEDDRPFDIDNQLFFDFYSLRYFESTMENVLKAEYELNRNLIKYGFVSLGEFYELLGIETTSANYNVGWSVEAGGMFYGYSWIDFEHDICEMEDGLECCCISFEHEPDPGFGSW